MNTLSIDTAGRTSFEPGEQIPVEVRWQFDQPATRVELRVVWNTSGKGTRDVGVASTTTIENAALSESRQIFVSLPEAPYSFSGRIVSVVWALEAVALPSRDSSRVEIVIGPDGQEVGAEGVAHDAGS